MWTVAETAHSRAVSAFTIPLRESDSMAMPVRWLSIILSVGILATFIGSFVLVRVVEFTSQNLPDHSHLADFKAPVSTRVFDRDGALVAEFADERREFVPIDRIPDRVIHAFLAAEDKNFFEHRGVDPWSIGRALLVDATKVGREIGRAHV